MAHGGGEQVDRMTETEWPIGMWPNHILGKIGMKPNFFVAKEWDRITFWAKSELDQMFFEPRNVTEFYFDVPEQDRITNRNETEFKFRKIPFYTIFFIFFQK
jgi:hypothetical protein